MRHDSLELVLGPPGTGKTTELLDRVDRLLAGGVDPSRIGYLAFTRRAAEEAKSRACARFNLAPGQLPNFRTVHSLAYHSLGMSQDRMFSTHALREFSDLMGLDIRGRVDLSEGGVWGIGKGDTLMFHEQLARSRGVSVEHIWRENDADYALSELTRVQKGLKVFKSSRGLVDFTDLLELSVKEGAFPALDTLFIDEAQDLSRAQWVAVEAIAAKADHVVCAGDDDQAIYRFAGADSSTFLSLVGRRTVLRQSHRVPASIQKLASVLLRRIEGPRFEKEWAPRNADGALEYVGAPSDVDLGAGHWLVLGRNNYLLRPFEELCRESGWYYSTKWGGAADPAVTAAIEAWGALRAGEAVAHGQATAVFDQIPSGAGIVRGGKTSLKSRDPDEKFTFENLSTDFGLLAQGEWFQALTRIPLIEREYLLSCVRQGEEISGTPRVRLSTIHGAKGGEADNVLLLTDCSQRTSANADRFPDDEVRTFYVGATRAKQSLTVCEPQNRFAFQI